MVFFFKRSTINNHILSFSEIREEACQGFDAKAKVDRCFIKSLLLSGNWCPAAILEIMRRGHVCVGLARVSGEVTIRG